MVEIARAQDDEVVEAFDLDALDEAGWHRTCHGSRFLGDLCGVSEPMFHTSSDKDEHAYTYDAVGNLTDLAATKYRGMTTALTHRRLVYDAFGRLVRVAAVDGMDETDVALYRYNGLNMRLMWHDDADADSTLESGERFYIMHDERWRPVATFRDADATPKEAFVWHAAGGAGVGGFGGSSYIDSLILRDRDHTSCGEGCDPRLAASDGTLEERRYSCQNWRADVVAVTKSDGTPLEYVRYSPYGEPTVHPIADLNMDGVVNSTDGALWSDLLYSTSNASVYADSDLDFDGADDQASSGIDSDLFYESYNANTGLSVVGRVSSPGVDSPTGYAGYQWDQTISANHVRYRVYLPDIGRWTRRDPLGYLGGISMLAFARSSPVSMWDASGRLPYLVSHVLPPDDPEGPGYLRGIASLQAAMRDIASMCAGCCKGSAAVALCKREANALIKSIVEAWTLNYGNGPWGSRGDPVAGYLCWDWADTFNRTIGAQGYTSFISTLGELENLSTLDPVTKSRSVHYYASVSVCGGTTAGCTFSLDDGFWDASNLFHPGFFPWPGSGYTPVPVPEPVPAIPAGGTPPIIPGRQPLPPSVPLPPGKRPPAPPSEPRPEPKRPLY